MTAVVLNPCAATTLSGRRCRRTAAWLIDGDPRMWCKQHAIHEADGGRLLHLSGRAEDAPARPPLRNAVLRLPVGRRQITRALDRARTAGDVDRCRRAVAEQLPDFLTGGRLDPDVVVGLRRAEQRTVRRSA